MAQKCGAEPRPLTWLRWLAEVPSVAAVIDVRVGAGLVLIGIGWALLLLLRSYPFLAVVGVGLMIMVASIVASPTGAIIYLPSGVQHMLLRQTMFDFMHDGSAMNNFLRRWVRIMMLCSYPDADSVQGIVDGIDANFVHDVLNIPLVQWLPRGLQDVLLPETSDAGPPKPRCTCCNPPRSIHASGSGGLDLPPRAIDAAGVASFLKEKQKEVEDKMTEPALAPIFTNRVCKGARRTAMHVLQGGFLVLAIVLPLSWEGCRTALTSCAKAVLNFVPHHLVHTTALRQSDLRLSALKEQVPAVAVFFGAGAAAILASRSAKRRWEPRS